MEGWKVGVAYERYGYIQVTKDEAKTAAEAFEVAKKKAEAMSVEELEAVTSPLLPETLEVDKEGVLEV